MKSLAYIFILICGSVFLAACSHHKQVQKTDVAVKKKPDSDGSKKNTAKKTDALQEKYAGILGVDPKQVKNEKLYAFINEWYAVPYKYAGKDKSGIDCSGFSSVLYSMVYQKKLSPSASTQADDSKKISASDLQEGDLVFFDINSGKISHVGVYLQNNKFVHASTKKGVIINDLNEPYYKKYFVKSGRVK